MAVNIMQAGRKETGAGAGLMPILILKEGTQRTRGKDAQSLNITAAKAVAAAVRSTLGPKGMEKMLVDSMGDVVITGDGAAILKEMDIEHPAAKMIVEVAKTQDEEVGDGTTTAVVIAGELLKKAEELFEDEVHPTVIVHGYKIAANKSKEILESLAMDVSVDQEDILFNIANTAIKGKEGDIPKAKLASLAVRAVKSIVDTSNGIKVNPKEIKVEKKEGGSIEDSELVLGVVIGKERAAPGMPKRIESARILLLNKSLEIKKTEMKSEIEITTPQQMQLFLDQEEEQLRDMVRKIENSGANVVFCQKGMDEVVEYYLAKSNILAAKSLSEKDMQKLAKATGGKIVSSFEGITGSDIGQAGLVEEKKIGDKNFIFVRDCSDPKSVSVILRGGTKHVVENIEQMFNDALRVVGAAIEDGKYVAGGGSPEIEVSLKLREYAASLKGREQLAVYKFAEAVEVIPRTLAENGGLDPIDKIVGLRSQHEKGNRNAGLDVYTGEVVDMAKLGVIEPLRVKVQAINSAVEAANMILRIDDVISAGKAAAPKMPPGGMEY